MSNIDMSHEVEIAVLKLNRGKVNAFNGPMVREFQTLLDDTAADGSVRGLVITGHGKFFSFGLDVPELYPLTREDFTGFLQAFTRLYMTLYMYPKPVVAALNGHVIAGGCMVAIACDLRLMAEGRAKIALNEITFGSTVFAGSVEMLRACMGQRNAEEVLLSGIMFEPDRAAALGLVDRVVLSEELLPLAIHEARDMASRDARAFRSMRELLRGPVAEVMRAREEDSIREFVDIWYSDSTREQLKGIEIRE
jgi:enoyl-CoA hydratase/carnithine racemase